MKTMIVVTIILTSLVFDAMIVGGFAYIVFWMGNSGWWWLLALLLLQGASAATYKMLNAVLFGKQLELG